MCLLFTLPLLLLLPTCHSIPLHTSSSSFSFRSLFEAADTLFNSDLVKEMLKGNLSGIVETFQSDQLWDTILSSCHTMLDHDSKLARQAKVMVEAELQEDPIVLGEAALELFYGDVEDEETHRKKRDSGEELGLGDWLEMIGEVLQQEYFLHHFREEQKKRGRRKKRQASPTMGGIFAVIEEDYENDYDYQEAEEDEDSEEDDGKKYPLYTPYIADVAYFFPLLDFFIPFDGTFMLFNEEYSFYDFASKRGK
eukprot:GFUD01009747.1.p1 GENE.GFUD01009747.1~~GFUD01009747.1.p1  ORF type:complete len:252 (-),score=90.92 GFUD01009747.1:14-769(-)